jgi:serine/threonine-protein phosphatase 2A regulatory subunit B''
VQRSIDVENTSVQLFANSRELAGGFMIESELERYIYDLIPDTREVSDKLDPGFLPYYVFTASRRFFFFLDPRRTRRIAIKRLAHSTIMEEFMFFRRISRYHQEMDVSVQLKDNWFRPSNAIRLYQTFIDLDQDENGMLNVHELMFYAGNKPTTGVVQLTRTAVTRIFEETIAYQPMEMDYKGFLDLILALENRSTPESMMYFFRILDIEKCGRLSPAAIQFFFRDIFESLHATGYDVTTYSNIIVEIYDMLSCSDTARGPTFDELVKSGQGSTVIAMLTDVNGFWQYDNRESLKQNAEDNDDNGQDHSSISGPDVGRNNNNGDDFSSEYSPDFEGEDNFF